MTILKPEIASDTKSGKDMPDIIEQLTHVREGGFKFTKMIFECNGFTPGCAGCGALQSGGGTRRHMKHCRDRITEEFCNSEEGGEIFKDAEDRLLHRDDGNVGGKASAPTGDDTHGSSEHESSEPEDQAEGSESVLVWMQRVTRGECTTEQVRDILWKLEKEIDLGNDTFTVPSKKPGNDIIELYSPPRIVARASKHGLTPGFSLDLTRHTPEGEPWDFSKKHMRQRAIPEYIDNQPGMLIFSSMCGPFSQLQNFNFSNMTPEEVEVTFRE